jgi:hypothetical protein
MKTKEITMLDAVNRILSIAKGVKAEGDNPTIESKEQAAFLSLHVCRRGPMYPKDETPRYQHATTRGFLHGALAMHEAVQALAQRLVMGEEDDAARDRGAMILANMVEVLTDILETIATIDGQVESYFALEGTAVTEAIPPNEIEGIPNVQGALDVLYDEFTRIFYSCDARLLNSIAKNADQASKDTKSALDKFKKA